MEQAPSLHITRTFISVTFIATISVMYVVFLFVTYLTNWYHFSWSGQPQQLQRCSHQRAVKAASVGDTPFCVAELQSFSGLRVQCKWWNAVIPLHFQLGLFHFCCGGFAPAGTEKSEESWDQLNFLRCWLLQPIMSSRDQMRTWTHKHHIVCPALNATTRCTSLERFFSTVASLGIFQKAIILHFIMFCL